MGTNRREEIAASVGAHANLGPGYDDAVAEGLVERIGTEIDQRIAAQVDHRIAEADDRVAAQVDDQVASELDRYLGCRHVRRRARRAGRAGRPSIALALGSMVVAVSATLTVLLSDVSQTSAGPGGGEIRSGPGAGAVLLTALIWIVIGVINVAHVISHSGAGRGSMDRGTAGRGTAGRIGTGRDLR